MSTPECSWPVSYASCGDCPEMNAADRAMFERMAGEYLNRWTLNQFGLCTRIVRFGELPEHLTFWGPNSSCGSDPQVVTVPGPIASITEIRIDDEVLPSTAYRQFSATEIIRIDGKSWPAPSEPWSIIYEQGTEVPIGGQIAAGLLACEFAKAASMDASCQLPKRLQSITRQGVTVALIDSFQEIQTGIWLIDSWIKAVTTPPQKSVVRSPDVPRRVRRR